MTFLLGFFYFVLILVKTGYPYSFREALRLPCVFPVFHNVKPAQVPQIIEIIKEQPLSSLSLRREYSMESVNSLLTARKERDNSASYGYFGASTVVSEDQIATLKEFGADFFSTVHYAKDLLDLSLKLGLPMFCAVKNIENCKLLISYILSLPNPLDHIIAMKLYPIKDIPKETFLQMISMIEKRLYYQGIPLDIIVSGGIAHDTAIEDMTWYLKEGVTNLAIGYNCDDNNIDNIRDYLKLMNDKLLVAKTFATGERYESIDKTDFHRTTQRLDQLHQQQHRQRLTA